jgi:hypothetical protein
VVTRKRLFTRPFLVPLLALFTALLLALFMARPSIRCARE